MPISVLNCPRKNVTLECSSMTIDDGTKKEPISRPNFYDQKFLDILKNIQEVSKPFRLSMLGSAMSTRPAFIFNILQFFDSITKNPTIRKYPKISGC